jgi:phosphopantothenoylcysteine decarboxylase
MNILLGVTGSVAAKLTPRLVAELSALGNVQVVVTKPSLYFWDPAAVAVRVWTDADEWPGDGYERDQMIPHLDLRRWADVFVIAPASANTLASLAAGRADNLLTSVVRAWDRERPLIVAPAMNTLMWTHPATAEHLETLCRWYGDKFSLVVPVERRLACGDTGVGALAPIENIVAAVRGTLQK